MQPAESETPAIADIIARRFLELKQDMDKIIVQSTDIHHPIVLGDAVQAPAMQQEDLPLWELHGRVYSATQGYDDYPLADPVLELPEAIPEAQYSIPTGATTTPRQQTDEDCAIQLSRRPAVGTDGSDSLATPAAASAAPIEGSHTVPTAEGPCRTFTDSSAEEEIVDHEESNTATEQVKAEKPWATSQLSYKELLEKALGGYDPRLPQQKQPSLTKSSPGKVDTLAKKHVEKGLPSKAPGRSKFPGALQQHKRSLPVASMTSSSVSASANSLRIFKQGSGSAQKLLEQLEAEQQTPVAGSAGSNHRRSSNWDGDSRRCRSAPREQAAEAAHVRRMSPGESTADGQLRRARSPPRGAAEFHHSVPAGGSPGYIERLYAQGVEKQYRRALAPDRRSLSPVRLSEDEWRRVTNRLHNDALNKEERMRLRREKEEYARDEAMHATAGGDLADRAHNMRHSKGHTAIAGSRGHESAFHDRQRALLDRRAERARQRRPSGEFSPEEKKECTFHPRINASSRHLYRSVDDMHNWDRHRQLHVTELQSEKTSHEFDDYTFMPEINNLSRKLALQSYAAAPDPNRWWTQSPVHTTAPDMRQYSPPRSVSPRSPTAGSASKQDSFAGPHMYFADGSPVLGSQLMAAAKPNPGLWSAPAAVGGLIQSPDSLAVPKSHFAAPATLQESMQLTPGVVMGVPVGVAAQQVPEDAVVIQMPGSGHSQKALMGPVAPGDGVAFIRLGPVRTSVPVAAANPAGLSNRDDERQRQVVSPVQAQMGLEQGLGSGDWLKGVATASLSRQYDSAASTPVYGASATVVHPKQTAARAFRDDSAGGYSSPTNKLSSGGTWFSPVTVAQKSSPLAKLKQADNIARAGRLQPSLSDATRAAIELSQQLGLREPSEGQISNYAASAAATARQQVVPAYYVAVDSRDSQLRRSNSYSQRYAYNKTNKAVDKECVPHKSEHEMYPAIYTADTALPWALPLPGYSAAQKGEHEAQLPATAAHGAQKYSTAQLLNSRTRTSQGGAPPAPPANPQPASAATMGQQHVLNSSEQALLAQLLSSMQSRLTAQAPQGPKPTGQMSDTAVASAANMLLDGTSEAHAASEQLLAHQKAEGLLNQTQSVPFELLGSPRSRLYLSSSQDGPAAPAAQQLLAVLAGGGEGPVIQALAHAVANTTPTNTHGVSKSAVAPAGVVYSGTEASDSSQATVKNILRPAYLPDSCGSSCMATPTGSSHNLMSQMQRHTAAAEPPGSKLSAQSRGHLAVASSPETTAQSAAAGSPAAAYADNKSCSGCKNSSSSSSIPEAKAGALSAGSRSGSDDDPLSASEVLSLLFDAELTPEAKAERMAKLYTKTLSKRNIQPENLQQALAEVSDAVLASHSASGSSPSQQQQQQQNAREVQAASSTPDNTEELPSSGHGQSDTTQDDLQSSMNIQDLLLRMSAENAAEK